VQETQEQQARVARTQASIEAAITDLSVELVHTQQSTRPRDMTSHAAIRYVTWTLKQE
jgi:hypothetical protein